MGAFQGKWERGSGVKIPSMPTLPICCPLHGIDHCSTLWVLYVKLFGFRCLTCVTKKEFCHLSVSSAGALCDGGWPSGARRGWQLLSTGCLSIETEALTCSHGPLSSLSTIQSKSNFQMSFSLSFLKDPTNPFFFSSCQQLPYQHPPFQKILLFQSSTPTQILAVTAKFDEKSLLWEETFITLKEKWGRDMRKK